MDLAENDLSGTIPPCFGNFSGMVFGHGEHLDGIIGYDYVEYDEVLVEMMKGRELEYIKELVSMLIYLDISSNNLEGLIPKELTLLSGLIGLNLSRNQLTGSIPDNIGNLTKLESLDLSENDLSSTIPQSFSVLTDLNHLNLSYNNLSGRIPSGNQLQTLDDPSIYSGNSKLCGHILENKCQGDKVDEPSQKGIDGTDESELSAFYIGMASGFIFGYLGVGCALLFKKSWRYAYFRFIEDKLYMEIMVKVAWLKRKLQCPLS
ncbi:hypothetical protein IFM89_009977 [Coptis chinensis]|uniref:Uncharacterized protein n=1 Tax=Coptis chinensis TaxID=261450 RepID=A0A835HM33_9MAGN|nr:hypothetical protein IFM89_009977 [Coptis chinensis]